MGFIRGINKGLDKAEVEADKVIKLGGRLLGYGSAAIDMIPDGSRKKKTTKKRVK